MNAPNSDNDRAWYSHKMGRHLFLEHIIAQVSKNVPRHIDDFAIVHRSRYAGHPVQIEASAIFRMDRSSPRSIPSPLLSLTRRSYVGDIWSVLICVREVDREFPYAR